MIVKDLANMRISKKLSKYDDGVYHIIIEQWNPGASDCLNNKKVKFGFESEKDADMFLEAMDCADGIVLS